MLIIGESLNASIPAVASAVTARDAETIAALARRQCECGAQLLDLNAAVTDRAQRDDLPWMVRTVQAAVDLPLMLDSSDPEALRAALQVHEGPPPILSSVTNEAGSPRGSAASGARARLCAGRAVYKWCRGYIKAHREGRLGPKTK